MRCVIQQFHDVQNMCILTKVTTGLDPDFNSNHSLNPMAYSYGNPNANLDIKAGTRIFHSCVHP